MRKIEPRPCEKPTHIQDRLGLRCQNQEGPVSEGSEIPHYCVFAENHPGRMHYAFAVNDKGVTTWFEWGVEDDVEDLCDTIRERVDKIADEHPGSFVAIRVDFQTVPAETMQELNA